MARPHARISRARARAPVAAHTRLGCIGPARCQATSMGGSLVKQLQGIHWFESPFPYWAHGVVVSHPLRMRKALGSNPSVSILVRWLRAMCHSICPAPTASSLQPHAHLRSHIQLGVAWRLWHLHVRFSSCVPLARCCGFPHRTTREGADYAMVCIAKYGGPKNSNAKDTPRCKIRTCWSTVSRASH